MGYVGRRVVLFLKSPATTRKNVGGYRDCICFGEREKLTKQKIIHMLPESTVLVLTTSVAKETDPLYNLE